MDGNIVREFKKLRVFTQYDFLKMDELVHDLSAALEESSKLQKAKSVDSLCNGYMVTRRMQRKKRGKKRRSVSGTALEHGMISEASESSLDEALKDYMENITAHQSDSDELTKSARMPELQADATCSVIAMVESDSVTENFSPMRPHRRRRRFKRMAVDPEPSCSTVGSNFAVPDMPETIKKMILRRKMNADETDNVYNLTKDDGSQVEKMEEEAADSLHIGKRKRTIKQSGNSFDNDQENACDNMCSPSSSSLSSSESDAGIFTNDELGRDADDEQSDFFHEAGPACGIPGIIPWWEKHSAEPEDQEMDPNFDKILTGSFEHMSKSSQRSFKARLCRYMDVHGREIRCGRRRLGTKAPGYSMSRYIQDQEHWKDVSKTHASSPHSAEYKRLRKTPPFKEGYVGESADPIPETNIGNKMLRSMGWNPGSGLGTDGGGIKVPVMAYTRPKRQGLGCSGSNS